MPYHISWHIEKQVVHVCFTGDVSEIDLIDSSEDVYDFMAGSAAPVHILYDGISIEDFPHSMMTLKRTLRHFCSHPAMGWLIFTGFSASDRRYVPNAIMQVLMRNFKHAHSFEDVDFILQQIDPTLQTGLVHSGV